MNHSAETVVRDTRNWLERAVIGLNLCPFAKAVHVKEQVHYAVSEACQPRQLLEELERELEALVAIDPAIRETTLLIAPGCLEDFLEFNDFLAKADRLLRRRHLEGVIQLASFHPAYQFAGTEAADISNFTNRSPYPTIHLLREASIERAVQAFPQPEAIYEANIRTLRGLGPRGLGALDVGAIDMTQEQLDLRPGQSIELLKELHILTRDGKMNQDTRRKLKQVYHLYQFIEPLLQELPRRPGTARRWPTTAPASPTSASSCTTCSSRSAASGRTSTASRRATNWCEKSQRAGAAAGLRAHVVPEPDGGRGDRLRRELPAQIDIVTALHACDTATDDAIAFALAQAGALHGAGAVLPGRSGGLLRKNKAHALARTPLTEIWRHPLHTREFGSQVTNVLRCLQLEAHGYQVTVTELVGWEHSMKNELILARAYRPEKAQCRRAPARRVVRVRPEGPRAVALSWAGKLLETLNWGQIPIYDAFEPATSYGPTSSTHRPRLSAPHHPARQQPAGNLYRQCRLRGAAGHDRRICAQGGIAIHAYVLMSNHFHLLATPDTDAGIPQMMQDVGRRYVRYFNQRQGRTGTFGRGATGPR